MERTRLLAELDSRIEQLSILNEVGNLLVSTLDQKVVRERAMEAITRLMHAEAGSLLLIDNESGELFFEVALGEKGEQVKQVRLKIGEGIAGWVARYGRPVNIGDVTRDRRFLAEVDRQSNFRTRSILCVPVKIKNKIIGVLQAINRVGREAFTKDDQRLFQLFSNQVAIALDNARLYEEVKETFYATSQALADAIEMRDPYTGGHTRRVLEYSLAIGRRMGLDSSELEVLKLSAVLHDIGKIGIEDRVLRKPAPLDRHEAAEMRLHPGKGAEILRRVPQLKDVLPGTLHHHERYDGKGYPEGLKNGRIPLVARIIAVSDTYDAMTTTRPYRKGLDPAVAVAELKRCAGTQFDRKVVAAFIEAYENGEITGCGSGPAAGSGTRRERGGP
ncbi:MAG TPA: HD domain-containing protein [Deltaproteobacteria bacterium]|nr:HD domain-containing protein [Deltaproteobacteria bacterium]